MQAVDVIHFFGGQGNRRRIQPDIAFTMGLHHGARVAGIGLQMQRAAGVGVQHRIIGNRFIRRNPHHGFLALRLFGSQAFSLGNNADRLRCIGRRDWLAGFFSGSIA